MKSMFTYTSDGKRAVHKSLALCARGMLSFFGKRKPCRVGIICPIAITPEQLTLITGIHEIKKAGLKLR